MTAKLGFTDIAGKARPMMVQGNVQEEIKYKLCKECFNCAMYLSNLSVVTLKGKTATRYEHFHEAKPFYAGHLKIWGEAGMVSTEKWKSRKQRNSYDFYQLFKKSCRRLLLHVQSYYRVHDRNKRDYMAALYIL